MYKTTSDFPQWVHDFNHYGEKTKWPKEYQPIADDIYKKANEIAPTLKLEKNWVNPSPYTFDEVNHHMGARDENYEAYPIFACNEGFRPSDWDYVYDSDLGNSFSRGGLYETKIGNWYFLMGFDFD